MKQRLSRTISGYWGRYINIPDKIDTSDLSAVGDQKVRPEPFCHPKKIRDDSCKLEKWNFDFCIQILALLDLNWLYILMEKVSF